ncbi:MAG: hypothetical protein ACYTKD_25435 [Planctomycetota bacterium]
MLGERRALVAPGPEERHDLVEDADVARRADVPSERQDRPEDDVAVRVAGRPLAPAVEEERLRPVAVGLLVRVDREQERARLVVTPQREQELERPLADVARPPPAAAVLLEAARGEVVHEGVVAEPGQDLAYRVEGRGSAPRSGERKTRRRALPGIGSGAHVRLGVGSGTGNARGARHERARDRDAELAKRPRLHDDEVP